MSKINKKITITLIFVLIGVFFLSSIAYANDLCNHNLLIIIALEMDRLGPYLLYRENKIKY